MADFHVSSGVDRREVQAWIAECCVTQSDAEETLLTLVGDYSRWAHLEMMRRGMSTFSGPGGLRLGKAQLSGILRELGYKTRVKGLTYFIGLRLKSKVIVNDEPVLRADRIAPYDETGQFFLRWLADSCLVGPVTAYETSLPDALADYQGYANGSPVRYVKPDIKGWLQDYWDRVYPLTYSPGSDRALPSYRKGRGHIILLGLGLKNPPLVKAGSPMTDYQAQREFIRAWICARCEDAPGGRLQTSDAYRDYARWAQDQGERPLVQRTFSAQMDSMGYCMWRSKGVRFLLGVRLRPSAPVSSTWD